MIKTERMGWVCVRATDGDVTCTVEFIPCRGSAVRMDSRIEIASAAIAAGPTLARTKAVVAAALDLIMTVEPRRKV